MENPKEKKIEAIYPLTAMQESLLLHHLLHPKKDEGFLLVQTTVEGNLDIPQLQSAWSTTIKKHEVLRSSVHWKNVEKAIRVILPTKNAAWEVLDWQHQTPLEQEENLSSYCNTLKEENVALDKNPLTQIVLIQMAVEQYVLIWKCHHLFLDGWSSSIILRDLFNAYGTILEQKKEAIAPLPQYKDYLKELDFSSKKYDAESHWKKNLETLGTPSLFNTDGAREKGELDKNEVLVSRDNLKALKAIARKNKLTLALVLQTTWALVLKKYFTTDTPVFGNTVAGRSIDMDGMADMTGMFMNVLPFALHIEDTAQLEDVLIQLKVVQQESTNFEHCTQTEILNYLPNANTTTLFDSLFIFENFPWNTIQVGDISVKDFSSGITTTYPVSLVILDGEELKLTLLTDSNCIANELAKWLLATYESILNLAITQPTVTIGAWLKSIPHFEATTTLKKPSIEPTKSAAYIAPKNDLELQLTSLWESVFAINAISMEDNFFAIGGKSLMAVKLFADIKQQMGVRLSPTTILEYPTIRQLAAHILSKREGDVQQTFNYVTPIRAKGNMPPLFCIHAGGGHVFFYNELANNIDSNRPVYALQPSGLFTGENLHESIEEMAKDYLQEIRQIQPEGVIHIMVYCFSTAVGLEMASLLKDKTQERLHLVVVDTMAEQEDLMTKAWIVMRLKNFAKRLLKNPFRVIQFMINIRFERFIKPKLVLLFGTEEEKVTETVKQNLIQSYLNFKWKPVDTPISLVLTEKADPSFNEEIITSWKKMVTGDIKIRTTKGSHFTLFESPDVIHIAEALDKLLNETPELTENKLHEAS